ncbi:MAG: hypothetical protein HFF18_06515 [Oscillospiraceae bacterium]|nr:hypothetical protein [Oscillospiraceae bacterium]
MRIIAVDDYALIRKKLSGNSPKLIKTGVQDMLHLLENGRRFPRVANSERQEFHTFIAEIMKNPDDDVRKWLYHLLCIYVDPIDDAKLIQDTIGNVPVEVQESMENVSWIAAVCAVHAATQDEFDTLVKAGRIQEYLTSPQLKLAASAFRENPFHTIDKPMLEAAMQPDDSISSIWLTKIFSNRFLPILQRTYYSETHGSVQTDMFVKLLKHPDDVVRKYVMWAFAQESGGNLVSLIPYVPPQDALSLEPGVLKWYFVKMFQDRNFLEHNVDLIQQVKNGLPKMKTNVREGILIGCGKLGYSDVLEDFLIDWEIDAWETDENLLLRLYEYFVKNISYSQDFFEIVKSAIKNMDTLPSESLRLFLTEFLNTEEGKRFMDKANINVYGGNVQFNMGGKNKQFNYSANREQQELLLHKIEELKKGLEQRDYDIEERLDLVMEHITYEIEHRPPTIETSQIQEILDKLDELKQAKPKDRGKHLLGFLSLLSNLLTIASATPAFPEIQAFVSNIVHFVGSLGG